MTDTDPLLSALLGHRDALDRAIALRSTEIVRAWMLKTGRASLCIDEEHRSLALTYDRSALLDERAEAHDHGFSFDGLNDAIGNLPRELIRWEQTAPSGYTVILADLNTHLGRVRDDRNANPIASTDPWEKP
ncbi:hypothetical protein [Mycolicibacterium palauense]|uniref:hypothetical protein n=1 Tax=Mycolicibacterium palauense TaxID=2034511 RepID=UPI000BFEAF88|nr:hypothetical protein [Mycolicibacterium palauense]